MIISLLQTLSFIPVDLSENLDDKYNELIVNNHHFTKKLEYFVKTFTFLIVNGVAFWELFYFNSFTSPSLFLFKLPPKLFSEKFYDSWLLFFLGESFLLICVIELNLLLRSGFSFFSRLSIRMYWTALSLTYWWK